MYEDADIPLPETFDDDYATRTAAATTQRMTVENDLTYKRDLKSEPPAGLSGHDLKVWKYQRFIKDYLRCVASVDDNVGRLMAYLDEQKLTDNTVVIYTSDQGFFLGDHGWFDKRFMYEESLRSPLLVRYPPEIKPGSVCDAIVLGIDYAPTFLDYAGRPTSAMPIALPGASLRPLLKGERPADWRDAIYYHYYESETEHKAPKHYGVRTATHKLIRFYELPGEDAAQWELYDLEKDPHELRNVYADPACAQVVADLKARLREFRKQYKDDTGPDVP
jgi:arylsulfatase A-like enzyme